MTRPDNHDDDDPDGIFISLEIEYAFPDNDDNQENPP